VPERPVADLRSDTITQPTAEMRRAMAEAMVADDGREGDPTARKLESMAAALTGHEAALFCTSGTMGNLLTFLTDLQPGDQILAERDSHFLHFEASGCTALAGALPLTLAGRAGRMDLAELESSINPGSRLHPRTAMIVAENTHNLAGGTCLDVDYMQGLWDIASRHHVLVHLDGARVFNAAVALEVEVKELTKGCGSVMIDLSKGLCAPYGSLLCGSEEFIVGARAMRQRVGGNVRQIGHMAAAGIVALETMVDRLADDHANARRLAESIHEVRPGLIDLDLVQTNIVHLATRPLGVSGAALVSTLEEAGVRCLATDPNRVRLVTHRDVEAGQIDDAIAVFGKVLRAFPGA
jgi:threonine aldolase